MDRIKFFEEWSREAAWVYGLILGDGHVCVNHKGGRILFCGNEDTVHKFSDLMGVPKTRLVFKRGVWHSWFDDLAVCKWFRRRGIRSKKSTTLPWPTDIPKRARWDFVRGLVDTDGSLAFNDQKKHQGKGRLNFTLGFSSATKSFVEAFAEAVGSERLITESRKMMPSGLKRSYAFRMGMDDSIRVCRRIYGDAPFHLRNEERYQKYVRAEKLWAEYTKGCQTLTPSGKLCGKPIHTGEVCSGHMWEAKKAGRLCEGCGSPEIMVGWFCCSCFYKSQRLMKNPNLKIRKRRT